MFHDTFYFNKLLFRNPQKGGGKIIHFQQALFINNSKTLTRLWLWWNLSGVGLPCITVSSHTDTKWSVCVPGGAFECNFIQDFSQTMCRVTKRYLGKGLMKGDKDLMGGPNFNRLYHKLKVLLLLLILRY